MPIAGFACPPEKSTAGEAHDIEHCVTRCPHPCYSPHLMTAIWWVNAQNYHKGRYVSATALSGCKRRLTLERTVPIYEQFSKLYAAFRGTITHTVLEEASSAVLPSGRTLKDLGFLAEWHMKVGFCFTHGGFSIDPDTDVDELSTYVWLSCPTCSEQGIAIVDQENVILGGTLDGGVPVFLDTIGVAELSLKGDGCSIHIDPDGTAYYKLDDLKTQKEYAVRLFVKGDPKNTLHPAIKDDYVRQARVYAYLASICVPPEHLRARGIKRIKFITSNIQAFAMGDSPYTGSGVFRWKDDYRHPLKDWPLYSIDLGTKAWVEDYIRENARPILDSLILGKTRGKLRDESQGWLCQDYCAFVGSSYCPNPTYEQMMLDTGHSEEEAFTMAGYRPLELPDPKVEPLTAQDTRLTDNFFRRQRGETELADEKKEKKDKTEKAPAKPRKKKTAT